METTEIQKPKTKKFIGISEVATITGYGKSRLYKLVEAKKMPVHRPIPNGKLFFIEEEIINWMCNNK